jgi:ribosomal protein S18 acetylase RimI-like enzyme
MAIIRSATGDDIPSLAELSGELGYETTAEDVKARFEFLKGKSDHGIYVAEEEGAVLGFISFERYDTLYMDSGLNLTGLVVSKDARNKGIGRQLLEAAEKYATEKGLKFLRLNSGSQRLEAHRFYRNRGFDNEKDQKRFIKTVGN